MVNRFHKLALVALLATPALAAAEPASGFAVMAPLVTPHTVNLELVYRARRRARGGGNIESSGLLDPAPGLRPLSWPHNSDMRSRLLTPELKRAPLVGWIAANLYRSRNENGWCLEVDPGEGEYLVFYRVHL